MIGSEVRRVGVWRASASGWRVYVPAVVTNAGIQALLVAADPVPEMSWSFGLSVTASIVAVVTTVALLTCAALAAVDARPRTALAAVRQRPLVFAWVSGIVLLTVAGAVLAVWLTPLVLIAGLFVLPAAADGARNPLARGFSGVGKLPMRYALGVVGLFVVAVLTWVFALALGFFVTGPAAAGLTWVWFGLVLVLALCWWSSLYRRAAPPR